MKSTIAIHKTPRSGPSQSLTLVGYSSVFPKINSSQEIYILVTIYLTTIRQLSIEICLSVVALRFGLSKLGRSYIYFSAAKYCVQKYHIGTDSKLVRKIKFHDGLK